MDHAEWAARARFFEDDAVQQRFEEWYGADKLKAIAEALRTPPSATTLRVLHAHGDPAAAAEVLKLLRESPVAENRSVELHPVLRECVVIRPKPPAAAAAEAAAAAPRLPRQAATVLVDLKCGEAVLRGADIFAAGVVASSSKYEKGTMLNVVTCCDGAAMPLKGSIIDRDLCTAAKPTPLVVIAVGEATVARADALRPGATGVAVRIVRRLVDHPPMAGVAEDKIILQNIPSMVPPRLLRLRPGMRVLDMCAAPGGKTAHLADLIQRQGEVVALDRSAKRVLELKETVRKAGAADVVTCRKFDSTKLLREYGAEAFDAVLCDPSCSALGLRPKLSHACSMKDLEGFASYQRRLLAEGFAVLKPGGRLVYSTCTISPLENEETVAWMLKEFGERIELEAPTEETKALYELGLEGLENSSLAAEARRRVIRFLPEASSEHTGFFVAAFRKPPAAAEKA